MSQPTYTPYSKLNIDQNNQTSEDSTPNLLLSWTLDNSLDIEEGRKAYKENVENKVLHLKGNVVIMNKEKKRIKSLMRKSRRTQPLTCKEKRKSGIYEVPEEAKKYEYFLPLNKLWIQYIEQLTNGQDHNKIMTLLMKVDFHGAVIKVIQSKNPTLIGTCGIVIHETKNMFRIINEQDKLLMVPKMNSKFEIQINDTKYEILGDAIVVRPVDRATKKFKVKADLWF